MLYPGGEGCEQVMVVSVWAGLMHICQGQHLLSHEEFACWSAPLSQWEMVLPQSVRLLLIFGKNHCESFVEQITDM